MSKKLLLFFFLLPVLSSAQNLVQNPSFEQNDTCPDGLSQLYRAIGWISNINSADYFNSCADIVSSVSIPTNNFGSQEPFNGNAYSGFFAYGTNPDGNEFLGGSLINPTIIGTKYYISFRLSLSDAQPFLMCGVNGIGLLFTNKVWGDTILQPNPLINNFAHVHSINPISDTSNWAIVSGSFIADSIYNYFLIGHFYDAAHTIFDCLDTNNSNNRWSYYFIDNVCISSDSSLCEFNSDEIKENQKERISLFPNPANNRIAVSNIKGKNIQLTILNVNGIPIKKINLNNDGDISIKELPDGFYFLEFKTQNQTQIEKIIIVN